MVITTDERACGMQLEELRAQQGDAKEDSTAPDKPLAQVLADAKQAKEDKFQAVWQSMKRGMQSCMHASISILISLDSTIHKAQKTAVHALWQGSSVRLCRQESATG